MNTSHKLSYVLLALIMFMKWDNADLMATTIVNLPTINEPPLIDGKLTDAAWESALVFKNFKTIQPDFGLPPSEATEGYLIYNEKMIYLGFRCFDREPDKIKATVSHRDNPGNDDWIAFCLDTFNDELTAYFFMVNPFGIQTDGTLDSNAEPDVTQDLVWQSAGQLTPTGYEAEIAIPFSSLRFPSKQTVVMGFKMARHISRKSEEVDFPEYHPERGAALAQFQKIELSGIKPKQLLEILPATTVNKKHLFSAGALAPTATQTDVSVTTKFGLTTDLVLDATYNPDFSQIETDAGQIDVNLRHSLYYPEKRPFFLEGQEWLGLAANPEDSPLGAVVHTRNIVDPSLGLKLTGKMGTTNLISAIYARDEYHPEMSNSNHQTNQPAHFSILRYARRLKNDSYLGGFYTGRQSNQTVNHVAGTDGRLRLSNHSSLEFHGFRSFSRDSKRNKLEPGGAYGALFQVNTRPIQLLIGLNDISKNFRTDVGYLTRRGVTILPLYFQYNIFFTAGWLQRIEPYYWARQSKDHYSGLYESFNVFSLRLMMPRQTFVNVQGWLANEVFTNRRFSRNALRVQGATQFTKQIYLELDFRTGKFIYYDPTAPFPGNGHRAEIGLLFQPTSKISSQLNFSYSDFYRQANGQKIYAYTIIRNRTTLQFNKYLFWRGVIEYNRYHQRFNADFLLSFTYIPGEVNSDSFKNIFKTRTSGLTD